MHWLRRITGTLMKLGPVLGTLLLPLALQGADVVEVDLDAAKELQVVVDREDGQYLGHPSTCLLEDGRTILCVYPKGHGKGAILYRRSTDGGKTWGERLPTPASWATSLETPTIHRVIDSSGRKNLILFSGMYPARLATSLDDGQTWSELEPLGDWGGIVIMGSVFPLKTGLGHYLAMFHDDGRYFRSKSNAQKPPVFTVYQALTTNGGFTWAEPSPVYSSSDLHLCEPGAIRSPDGKTLMVLLRENRRVANSHRITSTDEGRTWSAPSPLADVLNGDRHTAKYLPDGRLFISYRCVSPKGQTNRFDGDWVAWVGTWDDLLQGGPGEHRNRGQYFLRLKDNLHAWDCAYPGVEVLPDGTIVTVTYGHWVTNSQPYILAVRIPNGELDRRASEHHATARASAATDSDPHSVSRFGAGLPSWPSARILFSEDFESGSIADLKRRWSEVSNKNDTVLSFSGDVPGGSTGHRSLRMTAHPGHDTGGHLYVRFKEGVDKVHASFFVKFPGPASYIHHFVTLGGYRPGTDWPQGGAGIRPVGDDRFTVGIEPTGDSGRNTPPGIWNFYAYWPEMKVSADQRYWGNSIRPAEPAWVASNRWQRIDVLMSINAVAGTTNPGTVDHDGLLGLWVDGRRVFEVKQGVGREAWTGLGFVQNPESNQGFEGFAWRNHPDLKINFFWLLHYVTEENLRRNGLRELPSEVPVLFDDIVIRAPQ